MPLFQKIITKLWPISGLDLEPPFPEDDVNLGTDVPLRMSLLLGKGGDGSVLIEATSAGALKIADTGAGLESYEQDTGTAADAYAVGQTFEFSEPRSWFQVDLTTTGGTISLRDAAGSWGDDWVLRSGSVTEEVLSFTGIRIKNTTGSENTVFQIITMY